MAVDTRQGAIVDTGRGAIVDTGRGAVVDTGRGRGRRYGTGARSSIRDAARSSIRDAARSSMKRIAVHVHVRTTMDSYDVLACAGGRPPPRRAVVVDGVLMDKSERPEAPEIAVLSRACELARLARNVTCPPRHTADLIERALDTNSPECWSAAYDDIVTGDFDAKAANALMAQNPTNPAALATCLATAPSASTVVHVMRVMHDLVPLMDEDVVRSLGRSIGCQLRQIVDTMALHGGLLKRDVRDAVLGHLGRTMRIAGVPNSAMAEILDDAIRTRKFEALRIFVHADPASCFALKPGLFADLVVKAKTASIQHRAATLSVIAASVRSADLMTPDVRDHVRELVRVSLTVGPPDDARSLLALAIMAGADDDASPEFRGLARALEWTASHIVTT